MESIGESIASLLIAVYVPVPIVFYSASMEELMKRKLDIEVDSMENMLG